MEPVEIKVRPRYWDRTTATQHAVPGAINTIPAESDFYNKEEILKFIRRSADKLWVVNDGADSLYIRYATEGTESFSDENVVFPKEYKVYYNVFELRLRSPTAGLPYRVSEFEIQPCCTTGGGGGDVVVTNTPLPTDPIDRCARLLGQLCYAGSPIDPRAIRALAFLTDKVDVSGSAISATIASLTPVVKATVHNTTLPAAGADIFGASLIPTNTPCFFRITVAISVTGILTVDIINAGNEQHMFLNGGIALIPSALYTWDVPLHSGDTLNLEYSTTDGIIQVIRIEEIDAAVSV